jgi:uncharacterized protein
MRFGRVLRAAGLPAGTGRILDAERALAAVGVSSRDAAYWALHAVFVSRRAEHDIFDEAFRAFFRPRGELDDMMAMLLPRVDAGGQQQPDVSRRVAEAMGQIKTGKGRPRDRDEEQVDAILTASEREVLRKKDFEQMTAAELARARAAMARMRLPVRDVATRRWRPDAMGPRIDLRATLRAGLRLGGAEIDLRRRTRRLRPPPLVCLADISGSMERYTRVLLHFLHALTTDRDRVHVFLFGTRLTNVTRHLRRRDVDEALRRVSAAAPDWGGGTRIGAALSEFNRKWSRRVLSQGAVVLLITDGLDRDDTSLLATEMDRLHRSSRRVLWLNPLLRYAAFEPKAQGIRAILPHVDDHRPVHNLESLEDLAKALGA